MREQFAVVRQAHQKIQGDFVISFPGIGEKVFDEPEQPNDLNFDAEFLPHLSPQRLISCFPKFRTVLGNVQNCSSSAWFKRT